MIYDNYSIFYHFVTVQCQCQCGGPGALCVVIGRCDLVNDVSTNMKIKLTTKTGANPLCVHGSGEGPGADYPLVDSEGQTHSLTTAHFSVPVVNRHFQSSHSGSVYPKETELISMFKFNVNILINTHTKAGKK